MEALVRKIRASSKVAGNATVRVVLVFTIGIEITLANQEKYLFGNLESIEKSAFEIPSDKKKRVAFGAAPTDALLNIRDSLTFIQVALYV